MRTTNLLAFVACLLQQIHHYTNALYIQSPTLRQSGRCLHRQHQPAAPQRCPRFYSPQRQPQYCISLFDSLRPVHDERKNETSSSEKEETKNSVMFKKRRKTIPKWILSMGPKRQFVVVIALYIFHITVLAQRQVVFPMQLLPNDKGHFTGIGWDSIAGILTLVIYCIIQRKQVTAATATDDAQQQPSTSTLLPSIWSAPSDSESPWNLPKDSFRHRLTSLITAAVLIQTYFFTGRFSIFWEDLIYNLSGLGFYITAPMQRSLCVLLGHLSWLTTGTLLLKWLPRPPRFFGNNTPLLDVARENENTKDQSSSSTSSTTPARWFQSSRNAYWMWWVIGGYFVSSWLFNVADLVNHYILPQAVLANAQESVVTQLINPEHNGIAASFVGYIAPCLTAPWWEEVLYRGFGLAGLSQLLGYKWAVFLQGVIFSAHHMSLTAALPLAVLGWTWAILYTKSRNLWTVVLVHALWNSRVFLGSWLGL